MTSETIGRLMREHNIPQEVMLRLLDAVINEVMDNELEMIEPQETLPEYAETILKISSRVALIGECLRQISATQKMSLAAAQDQMQSLRSLMAGGSWQLSLDTLTRNYLNQCEIVLTEQAMSDEPDITPDEGGYDPIPREKYDPFIHE